METVKFKLVVVLIKCLYEMHGATIKMSNTKSQRNLLAFAEEIFGCKITVLSFCLHFMRFVKRTPTNATWETHISLVGRTRTTSQYLHTAHCMRNGETFILWNLCPSEVTLEVRNVCIKSTNDLSFKLGSEGGEEGLGKQQPYQPTGINYKVDITYEHKPRNVTEKEDKTRNP